MFRAAVVVAAAAAVQAIDLSTVPAIDTSIINAVNADSESTWTAGVNSLFVDATLADAKNLCGVLPGGPTLPEKKGLSDPSTIPASFDARVQWGTMCPSTLEIRDQSDCGSCWAFGAAEAITDRICIQSQGATTPHISSADINSCCLSCGSGCNGGYPSAVWSWWVTDGIVDGGNYGDGGCDPYTLEPCEHHINGTLPPCPTVCPGDMCPTPKCIKPTCANGASWTSSLHFGATAYNVPANVADIQTEIMTNGPVEASFTVYADFLTYTSGVYQHKTGQELGGHAIKILGWGLWTDSKQTPYWIVANSWNSGWGDQGFFNILRGKDECGIEDGVCAGMYTKSE